MTRAELGADHCAAHVAAEWCASAWHASASSRLHANKVAAQGMHMSDCTGNDVRNVIMLLLTAARVVLCSLAAWHGGAALVSAAVHVACLAAARQCGSRSVAIDT